MTDYVPDGQDPGDGGDDDGGNGGGGPPTPPDPHNKPEEDQNNKFPRKNRGGSGPPDGDDGDGDDPDDDDDEKFRRRMIKFLGGFVGQKNDDKPKVKEADTIKIPAFPLAETYPNWRIKTREAVVAASTDFNSAFKWVSESWKEDQTLEALRKVAPFATLDAKLLSALTNIITGDFATSPVRLIPLKKLKPLLDGLYGEDKCCACCMIILVQTSSMEQPTLSKICSVSNCVGKN